MAELYINAKECIAGGYAVVLQALQQSIVDRVEEYIGKKGHVDKLVLDITSIQGLPVYAVDLERALQPEYRAYGALGGLVNDLQAEMRAKRISLEVLRHMPKPEERFGHML